MKRSLGMAIALSLVGATILSSQVVVTHRFRDTTGVAVVGDGDRTETFSQAGLALSETAPKVTVQALKVYLAVGKNASIPLYFSTTLPALSDTTLKNTAASIFDEYGGLANLSIGYDTRLKFGGLFDFENTDWGMFLDGRIGGRVVEEPGAGAQINRLLPMAHGVASLRLSLPIFADRAGTSRAGGVTLLLSGAASLSDASRLESYIEDPESVIGFLNLSGAINITNVINANLGGTLLTNENALDRRFFVAVSVLRQ
jgi:hypothetical protein